MASPALTAEHRLPCGVEPCVGGAHARVWAPGVAQLELLSADSGAARWTLEPDDDGFHAAFIPGLQAGDRYWLLLDGKRRVPDPCSRFQPEGPHGPSQVVDPTTFRWSDRDWRGLSADGQVLYEMHIGTFTPEGTWRAALAHLPALKSLGVTCVEMMPVADFAGRFGWGYDGVNLYAPTRLYGEPDDLRAFVDGAHALGLGVILDVVYNHLGPDGNYLGEFAEEYFTDKYTNDWGRAINFEGPAPAREFFVGNAAYWIREYHFDGLRLDATQDMHDASATHVLSDMVAAARRAAGARLVYVVGENEPQQASLVRPAGEGGHDLDALWNDDFHHAAVVALTGRREAYYRDYLGSPQELISCAKYGFLYQGQYYAWQKKRRGSAALDLPASALVSYLENHDQIANSGFGRRLHQRVAPGSHRAMTAFLLLGRATPMLFQGQEFNASSPFLYFADHTPELRESIERGRRTFLRQFDSLRDPQVDAQLPAAVDEESFAKSRLDHGERERNAEALALHTDLLALRHSDGVLGGRARGVDGAVLAPEAFLLRFFGAEAGDRLLLVNLGGDLDLSPVPEPLLAPPAGGRWTLLWSSELPRYGGQGTPAIRLDEVIHLPGYCAVVFTASEETAA
jgi:maltooligosyltrehalose trehalohydrolase